MRAILRLVLVLALIPAGLSLGAVAAEAADDPGILVIHGADGRDHRFTVELARTEKEREYGLMNRSSMPPDHGMLFDFGKDAPVYMWMKDTLIPLDMLFIDRTGKIAAIAQRAVPMSETIIPSAAPVRAVLELNGGTAERLHIAIGDRVGHPMFAP